MKEDTSDAARETDQECDRRPADTRQGRRLLGRRLSGLWHQGNPGGRSLKVLPISAPVHSDAEIETAIIAFGREPGGGLVVMPDVFMIVHRVPTILAAARNNVPAVYDLSAYARDGGLLSYGVDRVDTFRRALCQEV
jgi:hypothetical protein